MNILHRASLSALIALGALAAGPAGAQPFPSKPLRIIIAQPPGGGTDMIARVIGGRLSEVWGQPIVVEPKVGAGNIVGTAYAATQKPDGYSILFTSNDVVFGPYLKKDLPYDPIKDFAPIIMIGETPLLVAVNPSVKANSVKELVAEMKAAPGKYRFGSAGVGSTLHLAGELFKNMAGVELVHVPYKGAALVYPDLIGERIELMFPATASAKGYIEGNKIKPLAVTTSKRISLLPNLPTVSESGIPGYESALWWGFVAPAGTPPDIVQKWNTEIAAALKEPKVREVLIGQGLEISTSTPAEFAAFMKVEQDRWGKIIQAAGVKLDD